MSESKSVQVTVTSWAKPDKIRTDVKAKASMVYTDSLDTWFKLYDIITQTISYISEGTVSIVSTIVNFAGAWLWFWLSLIKQNPEVAKLQYNLDEENRGKVDQIKQKIIVYKRYINSWCTYFSITMITRLGNDNSLSSLRSSLL